MIKLQQFIFVCAPHAVQWAGVVACDIDVIKLTVKEQDVWICCDGCKQKMLDDLDTYIAKLKKQAPLRDLRAC